MLNYIKNNYCLICEISDNIKNIYIMERNISLFFHPGCFKEASGEKLVNGRTFTKKEWLDFAGGEYSVAEKHCVEFADGTKQWYLNELRHREDGPAVEWAGGDKEWWLKGKHLSEQQFNEKIAK